MAEWSIAPVLKTGNPQGFVSSNLTASARFTLSSPPREGLLFGNHFAHPWSLRRGVLPVYSAHSMPHTPVPQRPFTVRSWWAGLLAVCTLLLMVACSSTKTPTATPQAAKPKTPASAPSARAPAPKAAAPAAIRLLRPAAGPVVDRFDGSRNKGIDIGGKAGDAILAAEAGLVVYAGTGLRGYGNLLIVKHNDTLLTAYAHNRKLLVKDGDAVRKGQKIAEMGSSDADRVKLHFEVRRNGNAVDPAPYIE